MKWSELTVHTTTFGAELVANVFFEMGACGVVVEDRNDVIAMLAEKRVWDYVDEDLVEKTSPVALVKGFVQKELEEQTRRTLSARLSALKASEQPELSLGSLEVVCRDLDDEDWVNVWKKHYKPLHLGRVVICPEWIDYRPETGETVVRIDPGMAFGTGEHETTSMCVELMQRYPLAGKQVIDVGCGSGILGAAALALGARRAYMVDFDPVAVSAAGHNLALNGLTSRADVVCGDLLEKTDLTGDVVFANITADILLRLLRDIGRYVAPGGVVILSGLIHSRVEEVIEAYEKAGFTLEEKKTRGEWNAAAFRAR